MSDGRLRELERAWRESGTDEDAQAYLAERCRVGLGTPEMTDLAKALAAAWTGKPVAETTTGEAIAALLGELKGHPKCSMVQRGERGEQGLQGEPGDQLLLDVDGYTVNVRRLKVTTEGVSVTTSLYDQGDGSAELRLSVNTAELKLARDRYGRQVRVGDTVRYKDQYGSETTDEVREIDPSYSDPIQVGYSYHRVSEQDITLEGYDLPQPPPPPLPPRYPSEADRTLRNAIEVNRWAEDAPDDIPWHLVQAAQARGGLLDVSQLAMDGAGRVLRVGNMVKHRGEVWNVDQVNLPGNGEEPYPNMRQLRITKTKDGTTTSKTVRELEVDYIDEREA